MKAQVFISYASKDREKVLSWVQRLRAKGISVWVDQGSIEAAALWGQEILEAIEGCKVLLLMDSQSSMNSRNVVKEVSLAAERDKVILPVYLEPVEIPKALGYHLAGIQHVEVYRGEEEENFGLT